jgi:hypothetical protein
MENLITKYAKIIEANTATGRWYCCSAKFGEHDPSCKNYKRKNKDKSIVIKNVSTPKRGNYELDGAGGYPAITEKIAEFQTKIDITKLPKDVQEQIEIAKAVLQKTNPQVLPEIGMNKEEAEKLLQKYGYALTSEPVEAITEKETPKSGNLVCVNPGRLEVVVGEAMSADVESGDIFSITSEDNYRYYGKLKIKGFFKHDPGLSGKKQVSGLYDSHDIEFAVSKDKVDAEPSDFWATWKHVSNETITEREIVKGGESSSIGPLSYREGFDIVKHNNKFYMSVMNGSIEIFRGPLADSIEEAEKLGKELILKENPRLAKNIGISSITESENISKKYKDLIYTINQLCIANAETGSILETFRQANIVDRDEISKVLSHTNYQQPLI